MNCIHDDEVIDKAISQAILEQKFLFKSKNEFAKFADIDFRKIKQKHYKTIRDSNIKILNFSKTSKDVDLLIQNALIKMKKTRKYHFSTKNELAKYIGIGKEVLNKHLNYLSTQGIEVETIKKISVDNLIIIAIKKIKEEKIKFFNSYKELAKFIGISNDSLNRRIDQINKSINIKILKTQSTKEDTDIKILKAIEKAKQVKILNFKTKREFAVFANIKSDSLNNNRIEKLLKEGIKIEFIKLVYPKSHIYINENIIENNIKINDISALIEYASEILDLTIRDADIYTIKERLSNKFDKSIIKDLINRVILKIKIDLEDEFNTTDSPWIMEIKLELLNNGYYLSEELIVKNLLKNPTNIYEVNNILDDTMERRIRYTKKIIEYKIINVISVSELPQINCTNDIIILEKINNKITFIKLWKEYANFLIKNKLTQNISKVPIDETLDIDTLFKMYPDYKEAFLLNEKYISFIEKYTYEAIASIATLSFNSWKNKNELKKDFISLNYYELRTIASGFLLWLNIKKVGLSSPKFLQFSKNSSLFDIADKILKNHNHIKTIEHFISNNKLPKEFIEPKIKFHTYKIATALKNNYEVQKIEREDFENYISSSEPYCYMNKTISHKKYIEKIFTMLGNNEAIIADNKTVSEYFNQHFALLNIRKKTLDIYSDFIKEIHDIAKYRYDENLIGFNTCKKFICDLFKLVRYFDEFEYRLSGKELELLLNPIIKKDNCYFTWLNTTMNKEFVSSHYKIFFDNTTIEEYKKIYLSQWIIKNKNKGTGLKRQGLLNEVYRTLQNLAFNHPVPHENYPKLTSTIDGKIIDMSWWKHKVSPIPAICLWLITKLPRRALHIANLDLNTFLQYDEFGNFDGFYFNTDKNKDLKQKERNFIPAYLVYMIFNTDEIKLIENYVSYIKKAYSFMPCVNYPNGFYEKFMPLFPNNDYKKAITKNILDCYYNKTMFYVQFEVQRLAKEGMFDKDYNKNEKDAKIEYLKNIELVFKKESTKKELPKTFERLIELNYSISNYRQFTTKDGIHNLRGVGATELMFEGMHFDELTIVTGHANDKILKQVYIKITKDNFHRLMPDMYINDYKDVNGKIASENYINNCLSQLIKDNEDSKYILDSLKNNGFRTQNITIESNDIEMYGKIGEIYVNNGLEIASRYHPIGNWHVFSYGICSINKRCPLGSYGICSICPHLMYNLSFTEGIHHKLLDSQLEVEFLKTKICEARESGKNNARDELLTATELKIKEIFGLTKMLHNLAQEKNITKNVDKLNEIDTANKYVLEITTKEVEINQLMINSLIIGNNLDIDNVLKDNKVMRITKTMLRKALINEDYETHKKLLINGLDWFLNDYTKANNELKKYLYNKFLSDQNDILVSNIKRLN